MRCSSAAAATAAAAAAAERRPSSFRSSPIVFAEQILEDSTLKFADTTQFSTHATSYVVGELR